ncbi:DUF4296 domain-containing protein [Flavobacterium arcticum]|uniref:DUF4296 domain-containing protein n=1 Tax=Flavobacterium arcticum TaxID=1784713 RepID=A0A345HA50_9FLAO|nr:DUF4296 domain-containing protein [Flavobacterium arcticum]AXG73460.1 DUF4296 domain-containing protein [Flavobacterium arcticum]KAF2513248.1 DUF4296 domain-containing protein [Flavobacterium arcticum]
MKRAALILLAFLVLGCNDNAPKEPEKLLSEEEMVNVLYDITMLQSIRSFKPQVLRENHVDVAEYVYNKYDIDSTIFAQNHTYYASQLDVYERIHNKVSDSVKKQQEPFKEEEVETKKDTIKKGKNKILDSIASKRLKMNEEKKDK